MILRSIECGIPMVIAVADAGISSDRWRKWWERYPKLRIRVARAAAKAVSPLIDKSYAMAKEGNERRLDAELKARVPDVYDRPKKSDSATVLISIREAAKALPEAVDASFEMLPAPTPEHP